MSDYFFLQGNLTWHLYVPAPQNASCMTQRKKTRHYVPEVNIVYHVLLHFISFAHFSDTIIAKERSSKGNIVNIHLLWSFSSSPYFLPLPSRLQDSWLPVSIALVITYLAEP